VIAALAVIFAVSVMVVAATLVLGPWRLTIAGITARVSSLDRALIVAAVSAVPLVLLTTRMVEVLERRPPFVFYALATIVFGILCCGPVLRAGGRVVVDSMPYAWLMYLPGFDQLRVPTRFWMLGTLCLGIAAGLSFARWRARRLPVRYATAALIAFGLLIDGWTRGITMAAAPERWPAVEPPDRRQPIVELPLGPDWDAAATFRGIGHRRGVVNGVSGYDPPAYAPLQEGLNNHDVAMLGALATLGDVDVVVNGAADPGGGWRRYAASAPGASLVASDGVRSAYHVPAQPPIEPRLGPALPVVSVRGSSDFSADAAIDGDFDTEWHDEPQQWPGQFLTVDLGAPKDVAGVTQALGEFARDFPRRLAIEVSMDRITWEPVWEGDTGAMALLAAVASPRRAPLRFAFAPRQARFVRLRPVTTHRNYWRVAELTVHGPNPR
jgi:hypothetical protein